MRLWLNKVGKRYAGRTVLRDISLELSGAGIVLVAGANGAGKSTLLRLMAGLITPSSGQIEHEDLPDGAIGYLAHATSVYPGLSGLGNLSFWQGLHRGDTRPATLMDALERVGLARHATDRAGTFSRGMLQRLNLARVLLQAPALLLLDEPGTGLDTTAAGLLADEIVAARSRGASVVWVSHQIATDMLLADRVVELAGRGLAYDGPTKDYSAFKTAQTTESTKVTAPAGRSVGSIAC